MSLIPGKIISVLTFPGVVVHEAAHRFFADIAKVPVYEVCYFRMEEPTGFVIHEKPHNLKSAFFISIGPFIINSLLCMILTFIPMLEIFMGGKGTSFFLLWLGLSIGMHAFPSIQDMESFALLVEETKGKGVYYYASKFFVLLFGIANFLSIVWFDVIYALFISFILPGLFYVNCSHLLNFFM